jgi:hypothetical protein
MRWLWVGVVLPGLVLVGVGIPAIASKPVDVREFEEVMEASKGLSDGAMSRKLDGMELTERLSADRLTDLYATLPGKRSQQSLIRLADESAFLKLPATDLDAKGAPTLAEASGIFKQVVSYTKEMFPRLPNFFATRDALRFQELKPMETDGSESIKIYDKLHLVGTSDDIVLYRDGHEVIDSGTSKRKHSQTGEGAGLTTRGVFGPIIAVVLTDSTHGRVQWGRWESGKDGPLAVFEFEVRRELSHYEVSFCCIPAFPAKQEEFKKLSAYHGEMTVDPKSGAILRLTMVADMEALDPVRRSQIVVDYGPVQIGGAPYICPTRSVSMLVAYRDGLRTKETSLTDVVYSDYHRFGTESTIITDVPEDTH